ncbi:MAG: DUF4199 domain-containing protein [Mucilaginibacter polytrichastri]|nr:DUF4199 domain-containing protein [Mucilaginibacter polytrichastri]
MENRPNGEISSTAITLNVSLVVFMVLVVLTFVFEFAHVDQRSPVQYTAYIPFIFGMYYVIRLFRDKELGGYITLGQSFKAGFRYSMFVALFMAIFFIIYLKYISPGIFEAGLTEAEDQMLKMGKSQSEIDEGMEKARQYGPFFGGMGTFIVYVLLGCILSLIFGAILQRKAPPFAGDEE